MCDFYLLTAVPFFLLWTLNACLRACMPVCVCVCVCVCECVGSDETDVVVCLLKYIKLLGSKHKKVQIKRIPISIRQHKTMRHFNASSIFERQTQRTIK